MTDEIKEEQEPSCFNCKDRQCQQLKIRQYDADGIYAPDALRLNKCNSWRAEVMLTAREIKRREVRESKAKLKEAVANIVREEKAKEEEEDKCCYTCNQLDCLERRYKEIGYNGVKTTKCSEWKGVEND